MDYATLFVLGALPTSSMIWFGFFVLGFVYYGWLQFVERHPRISRERGKLRELINSRREDGDGSSDNGSGNAAESEVS